jgi:cobalt transport protein ATP-binding subunit
MHHDVHIEDFSFRYPDGRQALKSVDLHISPAERVALVGPNGAGKSTLLLALNGTLQGEGSIRVGGVAVAEATLAQVRRTVGLVFEDPEDQLFSASVSEDVAFGPLYMGLSRGEVKARVEMALAAVGMGGSESRIPYHLSMGEKRRIAIATILAMEPEILALDDPTAGLDPRGRGELIQLLRGFSQTMLVATHDMILVRSLLPRMVILSGGRVVADGPSQELLAERDLLRVHGLGPLEEVA